MSDFRHVMIVGSGGREHAIADQVSHDPRVECIYLLPGNDGMKLDLERRKKVVSLSLNSKNPFLNLDQILEAHPIQFVIIGPDQFLSDGFSDYFSKKKIPCFGPSQKASELEFSKSFAKEIMKKASVPTADYLVCESEQDAFQKLPSFFEGKKQGVVIKADGLALGKGVSVCMSLKDAEIELQRIQKFSKKIILEEVLRGFECSAFAFCNGTRARFLGFAKDYKQLYSGGKGPNTGGMGAYSPFEVPSGFDQKIMNECVLPTLEVMAKEGRPYCGVLYVGLMVESGFERYSVLEFNSRFGDPETQCLLPRLEENFLDLCFSCIESGDLTTSKNISLSSDSCMVLVLASPGYPEAPKLGSKIEMSLDELESLKCKIYFSGVKKEGEFFSNSGGRVLGLVKKARTLQEASRDVYQANQKIHFEGKQFREDIGS